MTDRRPKRGQNRSAGKARAWNPSELWRRAPELPAADPIEPANDPTALLRSLAVRADARGSGLGADLLAHAESQAAALGVDALYLLTTTAERFFAARGYATTTRDAAPPEIQATARPDLLSRTRPMPSRMENCFDSVPSEWISTVPSVSTPSTSIAKSRTAAQRCPEIFDFRFLICEEATGKETRLRQRKTA